MKIAPFKVEEWMNAYEDEAKYNIAETCVDSISLDDLFAISGADKQAFLNGLCARRLTYGAITGAPAFKAGIAKLYKSIAPDNIVTTHGAAGANHHAFFSLISQGDRVITIKPAYQQLYSIPAAYGADTQILHLRPENGFLPDMEELRSLAAAGAKMICINNPHNPSGALMGREMLLEIIGIAREAGAYLLCDEVYRHLTLSGGWSDSVADLYEKGISIGSMSKTFSLAGLRLGWIATRDADVIAACLSHRDYNMISCGMFDEAVAALALEHSEALLERNRGIVRQNLQILDEWVKNEPRVHYVKPEGGTTSLVYYDINMPSHEFCKRLLDETGAFVVPGDCFDEPRCMRIGFAASTQTLRCGLAAISAFMDSLK